MSDEPGTMLATHVHPAVSIPVAVAMLTPMVWYWWKLGAAGVPVSRKRIRRLSLLMGLLLVVSFVGGLSFVDPRHAPTAYLTIWSLAMLGVVLLVVIAMIDAFNNVQLHRREHHQAVVEAAADLYREARGLQRGDETGAAVGPVGTQPPDAET